MCAPFSELQSNIGTMIIGGPKTSQIWPDPIIWFLDIRELYFRIFGSPSSVYSYRLYRAWNPPPCEMYPLFVIIFFFFTGDSFFNYLGVGHFGPDEAVDLSLV